MGGCIRQVHLLQSRRNASTARVPGSGYLETYLGICDTPAVKATAHNSRACAVRTGERVSPLLLMYATAVVLSIFK